MSKLSNYAGAGQEQVQDIKTSYIKIAQALSDEVNKNKPAFIPGLEAGMFFCPTTKEVYGETVNVIVLATRKSYLLTNDKDEFVGFADTIQPTWKRDAEGKMRTDEGYIAKVQYSYLVVTPDKLDAPKVLILKKTDLPAARDWNTLIHNAKLPDGSSCPIFGQVYTLKTTYRENEQGSWYALTNGRTAGITAAGFISDDIVDTVAELFESQKNVMAVAQASRQAIEAPAVTTEEDI